MGGRRAFESVDDGWRRPGHRAFGRQARGRLRHSDRSLGEQQADGPLCVGRNALHPMRGAGIPADNLLPRQARRFEPLHRSNGGGSAQIPDSAHQRQLPRQRRKRGRHSLGAVGGSVSKAVIPVRAGRRRPQGKPRHLHHHVRPQSRPWNLGPRGGPAQNGARNGEPKAGDEVGRGGLRPRVRPRHFQHRRCFRFQHGGDGEQGAEHLQFGLHPRRSRYGDRQRFRQYLAGRGPRIFP